MAWEQRRNGYYYYRKVRRGNRVTSEYVGSEADADFINGVEQLAKAGKEREREAERAERARIDAEMTPVDDLLDRSHQQLTDLIRAVLLASGYHQHKGQWRRKRDPGDHQS